MKVVFYYQKENKYCPAKKYFIEKIEKSELDEKRKGNVLTDIDNKIMHAKRVNGQPDGHILKPVRGYPFIQIKAEKNKSIQIRILYATYKNKLVLLDAFEKPRNYKSKGQREVKKHYEIAKKYWEIFKSKPKRYKKYE